ncbi:hydantoinase B/oxoprolinase family protein [Rhodococcus sp. MEB041]|uniref:hydantoinase B/oxoprolinase family protein n=1 Tax=Rhodococcus sp. MEB041 TaxID=3040323 RepID=UPI00254F3DD6|nr:hydantoinase B/oxoprolinase family protein [Rhodococcus sp. MEB041]
MTALQENPTVTMNVIAVEVLRHRLEALVAEASRVIERTAISPIVVENGDYCTAILDGAGDLVIGGGKITMQFNESTNAVKTVLAVHDDIAAGDVFLSNDPHGGGGLHPQDVFVLRPVFVHGELVAWVVNSAHLMDLGGMVPGSFAPNATECYQEALRFPPVRLVRGGVEQRDVWAIFLNNVRVAHLVEMDLRALVAGINVGHDRLSTLVEETGIERFRFAIADLNRRALAAIRGRIAELADGTYRYTTYAEWRGAFHKIPCAMTVDGSSLVFDFDGAAPQVASFLNSKDHVVKSMLSMYLALYLVGDLPHNQGYLDAFEVKCTEGSILNALPPAPVGAAHLLASMDAVSAALRCLVAAASSAPGSYVSRFLSAIPPHSGKFLLTWSGPGHAGEPLAWLMQDSSAAGSSAGADRDGTDFYCEIVGKQNTIEPADVETTESWYPLRIDFRRRGTRMAHGAHRGGAGVELGFRSTSDTSLFGTSIGQHDLLSTAGTAGGLDGTTSRMAIQLADGTRKPLALTDQGFELKPGDQFLCWAGSGAAWGDPIDRAPALVEADIDAGYVSVEDAAEIYGVVPGDEDATSRRRAEIGSRRLAAARAAAVPMEQTVVSNEAGLPIGPNVDQRGDLAVASASGAVLAQAPRPWTDGAPVLVEEIGGASERRAYLDPVTGHFLHVEVVPVGEGISFEYMPTSWVTA